MLRLLRRNSVLRVVVLFIAILMALGAIIVAQVKSTGQKSAGHAVVPVQPMHPLLPGASDAERPVFHPRINKSGAHPIDANTPQFLPAAIYHSGGYDISLAVADVNNDGRLDLVVADYDGGVDVLLGSGDGTFQPAVFYSAGAYSVWSIAVADLNRDGKPDLVVAIFDSNTVVVLLGNGEGTFEPPVSYASSNSGASCPDSVAIADMNGDGKPDLIVTNACANYLTKTVSVLLGNGDGTFQTAVGYRSGGLEPYSVEVADVNGDGRPDLLVANWVASNQDTGHGTVGVLLGNGDGTFPEPVAYDSGGTMPYSIAVADVNGDSKLDVVAGNCAPSGSYACPSWGGSGGRGVIGVLLGKGDGTFQPVATYDSGGLYAAGVVVADVNADAKTDIMVNNYGSISVGVLLGNGDGTFQTAATFGAGGSGSGSWGLAVADVNGDKKPDLLVGTCDAWSCSSGGVGVLLNDSGAAATSTTLISSQKRPLFGQAVTFTASVTSESGAIPDGEKVTFYDGSTVLASVALAGGVATYTTSSLSAGWHTIKAAYVGDTEFLPSGASLKQVVKKYSTTTTLTSSPNPSNYGQIVTFTATVTPSGPYAVTGNVKFWDGTTRIGTVAPIGGVATLRKSTLPVGTHAITAKYSGDAANAKSASPVVSQVVQ